MKFTSLKFIKSMLLSVLLMIFAVQVNAQGLDGPEYISGSATVCIPTGDSYVDQSYVFLESNNWASALMMWRVEDVNGTQLSASNTTYQFRNGSSTIISGWERATSMGNAGSNRSRLDIRWYPGTYVVKCQRTALTGYNSSSDDWTAFTVTVGAGTPPTVSKITHASTACSGQLISLSVASTSIEYKGYRLEPVLEGNAATIFTVGEDFGMIRDKNNPNHHSFIVNSISQQTEKFYFYLIPLAGNPVGSDCDGQPILDSVLVQPHVSVLPNTNTTICMGSSADLTSMINSKVGYTYEFFSKTGNVYTAISNASAVNGIVTDSVFYVQATNTTTGCKSDTVDFTVYPEFSNAMSVNLATNICMGSSANLTSMIDSVLGYEYIFFDENKKVTATPTSVGGSITVPTTFYVQSKNIVTGCLSDTTPINVKPVAIPVVNVTTNGTVYKDGNNAFVLYKKDIAPEFVITRTDLGTTTSWVYTVNDKDVSATGSPVSHSFPILTGDTMFHLTNITSEGCSKDTSIYFTMRIMPDVWVTKSFTSCSDTEAEEAMTADTTVICQEDELYLCALPTDIKSNENWKFSYTFTGELNTTAEGIGNTSPYSFYQKVNTDTLKPGYYVLTIDSLEISGSGFPNPPGYVKNNQINYKHTIEVVEKLQVTIEDELVGAICSNVDFLLPVKLTGGKDSITLSYTVNEGTPIDTTFRLPLANDTVYLSIPGQPAKAKSTVSLLAMTSTPCDVTLKGDAYTFEFTPDTLPVPTIFGFEAGLCLNENTSVTYTTEKGMTNYIWSIDALEGYVIENEDESMNDDSLKVTWNLIGGYNISVSYTDGNGCTSNPATIDSVTIYPIPSAELIIESYPDTAFCSSYDIPFHIANIEGMITDEYGDYNGYALVRIKGENGENVTLEHYFVGHDPEHFKLNLLLENEGLGAGNYTITIDTLIDLLQPTVCPGRSINEVNIVIFDAPTASIIGSKPDPICDLYPFDVLVDIKGGNIDTLYQLYYTYKYSEAADAVDGDVTFKDIANLDGIQFTIPAMTETNASVLVSLDSIFSPYCPMQYLDIDTTFDIEPLPVPTITIVDMLTDTACRMATVVYATEEDMTNYVWSISGDPANYIAERKDTSVFEVQWLVAGDYTVSIVYTDANKCTNLVSTDTNITVIEIPSAVLTFADGQEKHNCPNNNNVHLKLTASNVVTNGPWKVVYSAIDYNNKAISFETTVNPTNNIAYLEAVGLPAGKYTFRVDTLIELNTAAQCPGVDNPNTIDTVFIYPEITIANLRTRPVPACANEGEFYIVFNPNPLLYSDNNQEAIPHYSGYNFWVTTNGVTFPVTPSSWTNDPENEIYIPASALVPGEQTFVISRGIATIDGTVFCEATNIDSVKATILGLPVVEIIGDDTACDNRYIAKRPYPYTSQEVLSEYQWTVTTLSGTGVATIDGNNNEQTVNIIFGDTGLYQIRLVGKDEFCGDTTYKQVRVTPPARLLDLGDTLKNLAYVNCETKYFSIGTEANCSRGDFAKVMINMDVTGINFEYFETGGAGAGQWLPLNQLFVDNALAWGPTNGFEVKDFLTVGSRFRVTSTSDVRVESVDYSFVLVDATDVTIPWSDSIKGSFILTPATVEADLVEFALNNAIVNCEQQIFPLAITPNCQEGNPVQVRIELEEATDADDFVIEYDSIGKWVTLDYPFVAMIDSLTGETDTVLFRLISANQNLARDVNYTVYLDNEDATIGWDTLKDQMFRLTKNAAAEFVMAQDIDSIICSKQDIKMTFEPNCLLSDTNMGQLVIRTNKDISNLLEVYYGDDLLPFENHNGEFIAWPGIFNFEDYMETITLTLRSINPTIIDENVTFYFRIVDTASSLAPGEMVEIPNSDGSLALPTITKTWKVKGKPVAPIFTPNTVSYCQTHGTWVDFPTSDNEPMHSIYVWNDTASNIVTNASIAVYGTYDYYARHYDTTTACYSDSSLFVIDVMSDPNVLRMTSFVYCKDQVAPTFNFHEYFPENNPDVRYEYVRILDQTWYDTTHYPYNGFDSIPSFIAYNQGVDPIIISYKVIAHDLTAAACNGNRDVAYFTITINAIPAIPTVVSNQVYCNGDAILAGNSPFPANTDQYIYDWRRISGDDIFANYSDTGSGTFAFTAINNTEETISATFTVKPRFVHSHQSCGVDTVDFSISILPTPRVNPINQLTVCAGDKVDSIGFSGVATSFNWVKLASGDDVGLDAIAMSGKDTIPTFTANADALNTVQATYRITPVYELNGFLCGGTAMDYTITVLPRAIINPIDSQVICSNTAITPIAFTGTVGATFQWKNIGDVITGLPKGLRTENGIAASTLINNTDTVQRAKIRVYASNGYCAGDSVDFTIAVYPQPTVKTVSDITLCANETLETIEFEAKSSLVSTSFSWRNVGNNITGLPTSGTDSIAKTILSNTGATALTAIIEVTPRNNDGLCAGLPMIFNITVNPEPMVTNIPMDYELCNGDRTFPVVFEGSATQYRWIAKAKNIDGFPTDTTTGNFGRYTLTNTGSVVDTAVITVIPKVGTCQGTPQTFEIAVHPALNIANSFADTVICSGTEYPSVKIHSVGKLTWTVTGDQIAGLPMTGIVDSGAMFGGWALSNPTTTSRTAIVTLNAVSNTCTTNPVSFSITVNPQPTLTNTPSNVELCSGELYQQVSFAGNATAYNWTVTNGTSLGLPTSGNGSFGPFTLTNTTSAAITATVKVTPKYGVCSGDTGRFTIKVNPQPAITSTPANQVVCSGGATTVANFTGTGTIDWVVTGDNISGLTNRAGTGNFPVQTLTNTTAQPQMITVTATPTSGTCIGTPVSFTITVNPAPALTTTPSNATLCSGDVYSAVSFAGTATEFTWSVTNTANISGFTTTTGSNVFGPFTLTNTGTTAAVATVTVTPKYDACSGASQTFTITVNPVPTIARALTDTVICHNNTVSYNFGQGAEWTATGDLITGLPVSGTTTLSAKLENRGTTALTAVITVTPKSSTCTGKPEQFTITVNPNPVVNNVPADYTICNNTATTPFTFTGVATEYEWTVSGNAKISGFPAGAIQEGHFGSYMLTNTESTPQTATITVKPKYNNGGADCEGIGAGLSFKITVNPSAEITNTLNDLVLCDGESTGTINFTGATHYDWVITGDRISGLPTGVQTGNFGSYTVSNTGNTTLTATVAVTPRYIDGGVNCTGTSVLFDIVVNPSTVVTSAGIVANKTNFCVGETMLLSVEATGTNLTYEWYKDGSMIATSNEYEVPEVGIDATGDYYVIVKGACGNVTSDVVRITVGSGDMLLEKHHDIIFVDNYAKIYTDYQWYKDGKKIEGATKQFYHEPGGLKGCYYVVLNGGAEISCEKCYDNTKLASKEWKLSVYPNPSKQGNNATGILLSNDDVKYEGSLNVTIHNMNGAEVLRMNKVEGQFDVETIQLAPGVYNVKVVTEEGKIYNEKMIVY